MVVKLRKLEAAPSEPGSCWRGSATWEARGTPLILLKAPCALRSPASWRFMIRRSRDSSYPGVALTRSEEDMAVFHNLASKRFSSRREAVLVLQMMVD